jgi:pilus assembly protein CpaE
MQPLSLILLSKNNESSKDLQSALAASARVRILATCQNADQMQADIIRMRPSAAVITLDATNSEKEFLLIKKLVAASPGTAIITAASDASPSLILGSMRSGAREFLQIPIIEDELQTVLDRTAEFCSANDSSSQQTGRVVAVFSGKGGAGVSFFATNLAAAMTLPTLLVDLNLQAGDAASFLGLEARYSLADFVSNRARLDDSLISSMITKHSNNLSLLAAPLEAHEAEEIKPQDLTEVLHLLSQRYERIVLDLPHTFDPVTVAGLDRADDIFLLLTLDIPGIRSTKRALTVFDRLDYPRRKIHVVVNRWSKNIDVELQKVQTHLGQQFIGLVPNDYRKVMDSINLGQPHVQADPSSKIAAEIRRIATIVSEDNQSASAQPKKRLLGGMFGRQRSSPESLELAAVGDTN